jgi:hypothetical protein
MKINLNKTPDLATLFKMMQNSYDNFNHHLIHLKIKNELEYVEYLKQIVTLFFEDEIFNNLTISRL